MAQAIEVVTKDKLNDQGNGEFTATVDQQPNLTRDGQAQKRDGSNASQAGDVLSVQPDGTLQTRPKGTNGNFERCVVTPAGLVYRPVGKRTFLVPFASDWPNK